jgi:hypothetical protein
MILRRQKQLTIPIELLQSEPRIGELQRAADAKGEGRYEEACKIYKGMIRTVLDTESHPVIPKHAESIEYLLGIWERTADNLPKGAAEQELVKSYRHNYKIVNEGPQGIMHALNLIVVRSRLMFGDIHPNLKMFIPGNIANVPDPVIESASVPIVVRVSLSKEAEQTATTLVRLKGGTWTIEGDEITYQNSLPGFLRRRAEIVVRDNYIRVNGQFLYGGLTVEYANRIKLMLETIREIEGEITRERATSGDEPLLWSIKCDLKALGKSMKNNLDYGYGYKVTQNELEAKNADY